MKMVALWMRGLMVILWVGGATNLLGVVQNPIEQGKALFQAKRYGEALTVLIHALERDPGNVALLKAIGQVTAVVAEEEQSLARPNVRREVVKEAWHALGRSSPEEAEQILRQARSHEQAKQWILAWMAYQELVVQRAPTPFVTLAQKRQAEILRWLQRKTTRGQKAAPLYFQGLLDYSKEAFAEAITAWQTVVTQTPDQHKELTTVIERARIEWEPKRRAAELKELTAKAQAAEQVKQYPEARATWAAVLVLVPSHPEAKNALARLERKVIAQEWAQTANRHLERGNLREAVQAALSAFRNFPEDKDIQSLLERIELQLSRQALAGYADSPLRPLKKTSPRTGMSPSALHPTPAASGPLNGGERAIDSQQAATYYNLGLIQYVQGNVKEAITHWRKALVYDPFHTKAKQALDRALAEAKGLR
ncbi:MAG: tetratricopeptide repeat protein [Elusimicrobia bacterium]|nr:tetratricopeptide repeat protein [Elusimicrobiota bacterium]